MHRSEDPSVGRAPRGHRWVLLAGMLIAVAAVVSQCPTSNPAPGAQRSLESDVSRIDGVLDSNISAINDIAFHAVLNVDVFIDRDAGCETFLNVWHTLDQADTNTSVSIESREIVQRIGSTDVEFQLRTEVIEPGSCADLFELLVVVTDATAGGSAKVAISESTDVSVTASRSPSPTSVLRQLMEESLRTDVAVNEWRFAVLDGSSYSWTADAPDGALQGAPALLDEGFILTGLVLDDQGARYAVDSDPAGALAILNAVPAAEVIVS